MPGIVDACFEIRTDVAGSAIEFIPGRVDEAEKLWGIPNLLNRLPFEVPKEVLCFKGHLLA